MIALDANRSSGFANETFDDILVVHHLGKQKLDRDPVVQCLMGRLDHNAHSARAQYALDPVLAGDDVALTHLQAEVAVIESDREIEPPRGWTGLRSRRYGGTLVSIIRRSDATEPADAGSGIETRSTK